MLWIIIAHSDTSHKIILTTCRNTDMFIQSIKKPTWIALGTHWSLSGLLGSVT